MSPDKYTATWVSHSSISSFLKCPRAYFLKHRYKDPLTGNKIAIVSPPLALGQAVHEVIESLSEIKVADRFKQPLASKLEDSWKKVTGKKGGFTSEKQEAEYKKRAQDMLKKVTDNPGPLKNLAVKIQTDFIPNFYLSEEDNIILSGKIDWLEYFPDTESVHIIDFKTGQKDEPKESLQLPIYYLLATNCQKYPVTHASYWYVARSDKPQKKKLPNLKRSKDQVLKIAKKIKLARSLNRFVCPQNGCRECNPFEKVLKGEAELVGKSDYQDIYLLHTSAESDKNSILL